MNSKNISRFALRAAAVVLLVLVFAAPMLLRPTPAKAAARTASVSGNWSDTATWGGASVPGSTAAGDTVVINSGRTVTLDASPAYSIASLTLNAPSSNNALNWSSTQTLTVTGAVTMNSPSSGTITSTIAVGAGTLNAASIAIPGSATAGRYCTVSVSTGTIDVSGNVTFSGTAAQARLTFTGAGTLNIGGNLGTGGTFTKSTGTVNCDGSSAQTVAGYNYNVLKSNNTAGVTLVAATTITTLTIGDVTASSLFKDGGFVITPGSSSVLNLTRGTYNLGSATVGTAWPAWGTRNITAGTTVGYVSAVAQAVSVTPTYPNLTISGASTKTQGTGTLNVNETLTIGAGATFARGTNLVNCGGLVITGTLTTGNGTSVTVNGNVSGAGTITAGGTARVFNVTGNWTFSGTCITSISLTMNGTGDQTLSGVINQSGATNGALIINKASGKVTLGSNITVVGSTSSAFTLTAGTFDAATYLLTATTRTFTAGTLRVGASTWAGNFSGAITQPAAGTIEYYASGPQTVNNVTYPGHLTLSGSGAKTFGTSTTTITGNLTLSGTATATTVVGLAIGGNLVVGDGATFTAAGYALTVTGATTVGGGTSGNLTISSATGAKTFTGLVTVNSGGTWNNSGNSTITFRGGITNSGAFTAGTGVQTFNTNAQALAGTLSIPSVTVTGVTLTNNGTLTAATALSGTGGLTNAATGALNIGGTSGITALTATAVGNTVTYNGATQTVMATTYDNLTINQSGGDATLGAAATVNGILTLTAGNLAVTDPYVLTMGSSATTTGTKDVTGIVKRSSMVHSTSYSFGNQFTTVNWQNLGTLPTDLSLKISIGSAPSWMTGAVQRYYDIMRAGGSGAKATLTLHYLDSELNGNTEVNLVLWDYHPSVTRLDEHGRADNNTSDNWASLSNIGSGYMSTSWGDHLWALGDSQAVHNTWLGVNGTDWTDVVNWSGGAAPISTDDVLIPDAATTTYDPTLPAGTVTIKTMTLQSGAILNSGASSTLTVSGSSGAWSNSGGTFNPSTGTVVFTNAAATISGTTDFYNVTIDPGAILGIEPSSTTRIAGTITNNGAVTHVVGEGSACTVEYNGTSQTVINPNGSIGGYHNLILSGSGTKTMPGTALSINGNFSISGTASVAPASALTIAGTITIGSGTTFTGGAYTHNVAGDWTNNVGAGTVTLTGTTINLNGTSAQAIGGSTATAFNNLTVNKSGGTATLGINVTCAGDLTVTAGTLDLSGYTANRASGGGTLTVSSSATLKIGGTNTFPTNYSTHTFGATSTVNYSGTSQTVASDTYTGHLTTSGSGTKTLGGAVTVGADLTIGSGTTLDVSASDYALAVKGSWSNSGTFTQRSGTVTLNGSSAQAMSGATTFNSLTINNSSGLTISNNETVNGTLTLTSGNISTGANSLIIASGGGVSRTSGHVIGNLQRAAAVAAIAFDIGTATVYAPVSVTISAISGSSPTVTATTTDGVISLGNSGISTAKYVNRYWTMTPANVTTVNYDAQFTFANPGDLVGSPDPANFIVRKYDTTATTWSRPPGGSSNAGGNTTTGSGFTSFSQFAVGEPLVWASTADPVTVSPLDMSGAAFGASSNYNIAYYDATLSTPVAWITGKSSNGSGALTDSLPLQLGWAPGTWHAVVQPASGYDDLSSSTYDELSHDQEALSAHGIIGDSSFTVNAGAVPELPTVAAGAFVLAACFAIYYWKRKRQPAVGGQRWG